MMGDDFGRDSHGDPPSSSHRGLDGDFMTILVFCFCHVEYREDRRGENENCSINKVTSRRLPLSVTTNSDCPADQLKKVGTRNRVESVPETHTHHIYLPKKHNKQKKKEKSLSPNQKPTRDGALTGTTAHWHQPPPE